MPIGSMKPVICVTTRHFILTVSCNASQTSFPARLLQRPYIFNLNIKIHLFVVKGDADKLEQVLANLLTNAIKFTPSGTISFYSKYLEGNCTLKSGIPVSVWMRKR